MGFNAILPAPGTGGNWDIEPDYQGPAVTSKVRLTRDPRQERLASGLRQFGGAARAVAVARGDRAPDVVEERAKQIFASAFAVSVTAEASLAHTMIDGRGLVVAGPAARAIEIAIKSLGADVESATCAGVYSSEHVGHELPMAERIAVAVSAVEVARFMRDRQVRP